MSGNYIKDWASAGTTSTPGYVNEGFQCGALSPTDFNWIIQKLAKYSENRGGSCGIPVWSNTNTSSIVLSSDSEIGAFRLLKGGGDPSAPLSSAADWYVDEFCGIADLLAFIFEAGLKEPITFNGTPPVIMGGSIGAVGSTGDYTVTTVTASDGQPVTHEWKMDGVFVSPLQNPTITYPSTGMHELCYTAIASDGTKTEPVCYSIETLIITPPSAVGVIDDLPATVTRGASYVVTLSGGVAGTNAIASRTLANPIGCTLSAPSGNTITVTINADATSVSVTPVVTDNVGLSSTNGTTITRSSANIVQPTSDSGVLTTGTHTRTVGPGVTSTTFIANGGGGTAAVAGTTCGANTGYLAANAVCGNTDPPSHAGQDGCYQKFLELTSCAFVSAATGGTAGTAGASTTVTKSGVTVATFSGAATGVVAASATTSQTITGLDPSIAHTFVINVAANGGTARLTT